ncbi:hypothetical protein NQZ68_040245 [Dissostichus eleginoides]|nr:hypothetical protein NQZ68_040245 [Dissostichus eleginoides]
MVCTCLPVPCDPLSWFAPVSLYHVTLSHGLHLSPCTPPFTPLSGSKTPQKQDFVFLCLLHCWSPPPPEGYICSASRCSPIWTSADDRR